MKFPPIVERHEIQQGAKSGTRVVVVCEHASNHFPAEFGDLGLSDDQKSAHIAWDPGALGVARTLAKSVGADLVAGSVSRLIYDCNRPPEAPSAYPEKSEIFSIPGNADLSSDEKGARVAAVYEPFSQGLIEVLDRYDEAVIVTVHSFTPVYHGELRSCEVGILHDDDSRLADQLLKGWPADAPLRATRNDPYGPKDGVTHTLIEHGISRGWRNVMIEVRNDLIATPQMQEQVGLLLAERITEALDAEMEC